MIMLGVFIACVLRCLGPILKRCHRYTHYPSKASPKCLQRQCVQTEEIAVTTANRRTQKVPASPIRVTLPVSVACDLERFQTALANVAALVRDKHFVRHGQGVLSCVREFVVDRVSLEAKEAVADTTRPHESS